MRVSVLVSSLTGLLFSNTRGRHILQAQRNNTLFTATLQHKKKCTVRHLVRKFNDREGKRERERKKRNIYTSAIGIHIHIIHLCEFDSLVFTTFTL